MTNSRVLDFRIHPLALRASRVLVGLVALYVFGTFRELVPQFFGPHGYLSYADVQQIFRFPPVTGLFVISEAEGWIYFLISVAQGLALCMCLGLLPRLAAGLLFFLALGFCERFPGIFSPLDLALRVSLLWLALLPADGTVLDRRTQRAWYYLWSTQLIIIYFTTFLEKWPNPLWSVHGDALATVMRIKLYTTPFAEDVLRLPGWALKTLSFATLAIEGLLPWMLLYPRRRVRQFLCVTFFLFHLSIALTMRVGGFAELSIAWWLLIWPGPQSSVTSPAPPTRRHRIRLAFAGLLVTCFCLSALHRQFGTSFPIGGLDDLLRVVHLRQGWWMFGRPNILAQNGWISVQTWAASGESENPFLDPADSRDEFTQLRDKTLYEKKFFTKILKENRSHFFEVLERYLCERWQPRQLDRVAGFELVYQYPVNASGELRRYRLHRQDCQRAQIPTESSQGR